MWFSKFRPTLNESWVLCILSGFGPFKIRFFYLGICCMLFRSASTSFNDAWTPPPRTKVCQWVDHLLIQGCGLKTGAAVPAGRLAPVLQQWAERRVTNIPEVPVSVCHHIHPPTEGPPAEEGNRIEGITAALSVRLSLELRVVAVLINISSTWQHVLRDSTVGSNKLCHVVFLLCVGLFYTSVWNRIFKRLNTWKMDQRLDFSLSRKTRSEF